MSTDLIVREAQAIAGAARPTSALALWDAEQLDVIKTLICPGASDAELRLFGQVCQKSGLDPFSRQIYGIMRGQRQQVNGAWKTIDKLSIQTSIDGFRLIAERSGKYGGQLGPQWCGPDGVWRDVWLAAEYPSAARVGVLRIDWQEPLWAVARWDSYVQTHRDRETRQDVVGTMWQRMPDVMIAKVAESLALRRAFPAELSGLYTTEEMQQADRERASEDVRPVQVIGSVSRPRPEPSASEQARAQAIVEPPLPQRALLEQRHRQLGQVAVERQHPKAEAINQTDPADLTDAQLIKSVRRLEELFPDVPEQEPAF